MHAEPRATCTLRGAPSAEGLVPNIESNRTISVRRERNAAQPTMLMLLHEPSTTLRAPTSPSWSSTILCCAAALAAGGMTNRGGTSSRPSPSPSPAARHDSRVVLRCHSSASSPAAAPPRCARAASVTAATVQATRRRAGGRRRRASASATWWRRPVCSPGSLPRRSRRRGRRAQDRGSERGQTKTVPQAVRPCPFYGATTRRHSIFIGALLLYGCSTRPGEAEKLARLLPEAKVSCRGRRKVGRFAPVDTQAA